jgi:gluconokinase
MLKESYRTKILVDPAKVKIVYLKADRQTIEQRLAHRTGHFMNPTLIGSQFEALQQPRNAVVVNATEPVDEVVKRIRSALNI